MQWTPHVTVAAIIERDNKFFLVEEQINNQLRLNQPAGHWENGETLIQAVIRETLEETAWHFVPTALVGIYHWPHPIETDLTYLRFAFKGNLIKHEPSITLDTGIERALWMSLEEIRNQRERHRSPQLMLCIEDYLAGNEIPLDFIKTVQNF